MASQRRRLFQVILSLPKRKQNSLSNHCLLERVPLTWECSPGRKQRETGIMTNRLLNSIETTPQTWTLKSS
jgi:hypothetical protein